jgi:hypothetical protein
MPRAEFVEQLRKLGYEVVVDGDKVSFPYKVPIGKFADKEIQLGFQVADDFPLNPPGGPHISVQLLPIHIQNDLPHPAGGVHPSPVWTNWQYWSRPFSNWNQTDKTVATYMAHIRKLFETQ